MTEKIFISGPSGSGKTTLAKYIAHRYNIPFVQGSTKPLWPEWKIPNHEFILKKGVEDPEWGLAFQHAVLDYRKSMTEGMESFVTDRGPLDNVLYFLLQNAPYLGNTLTETYIDECKLNYPVDPFHQIYLDITKDKDFKLEDDGMRVNNIYFQEMTDSVYKYIMDKDLLEFKKRECEVSVIGIWDWESRIDVIEYLMREQTTIWQEVRRMFGL